MTNHISDSDTLAVHRVRHPLKFRQLRVLRTQHVSAQLLRITLTGDDLDGFISASFDDHIKVFLPGADGVMPPLPTATADGVVYAEGAPRPIARDYTPRRYDAQTRELDIEFFLHATGPASDWARAAQVGDTLGVGGPRGSFVVPTGFDWHVLIGDESALPAIARRFEELPPQANIVALIEVDDAAAQIALPTRAQAHVTWVHRRGAVAADEPALAHAARKLALPEGEGYVWVAAESIVTRAVRQVMVDVHGIAKSRIRASSYWKRGAAGVHETIDD
ncbi:siderophore-interacting protein [Alcaligenaceae bacterium A4P071]|nr:siderophore-interacting protein [Alcaligenaceae bacterium A4P071]